MSKRLQGMLINNWIVKLWVNLYVANKPESQLNVFYGKFKNYMNFLDRKKRITPTLLFLKDTNFINLKTNVLC